MDPIDQWQCHSRSCRALGRGRCYSVRSWENSSRDKNGNRKNSRLLPVSQVSQVSQGLCTEETIDCKMHFGEPKGFTDDVNGLGMEETRVWFFGTGYHSGGQVSLELITHPGEALNLYNPPDSACWKSQV